jgi:hypothetical protein
MSEEPERPYIKKVRPISAKQYYDALIQAFGTNKKDKEETK